MHLDRDLQRRILAELRNLYPMTCNPNDLFADVEPRHLMANLCYLAGHHLIALPTREIAGTMPHAYLAGITCKGLDFLADDGGLSAVLGVVTVRMHDETIKTLIQTYLDASDADPGVKAQLTEMIRSLPAAATKEVELAAIQQGLRSLPDLAQWLYKWIAS